MVQLHDNVGQIESGFGLLGIVERTEDGALCHECGSWYRQLGTHIAKAHMSVAEYRAKHQLPASTPLTSLGLSATFKAYATARIGSPGWQRFQKRGNEVRPLIQHLAAEASKESSAGTKAVRAKRMAAVPSSHPNEARWDQRLSDVVAHYRKNGRVPCTRSFEIVERALGKWWLKQWCDLRTEKLSIRRKTALQTCLVPPPRINRRK